MKSTLLPSLVVSLSTASGLMAWGCVEVGHPVEVGCFIEYDNPNCDESIGATTSSHASGTASTGTGSGGADSAGGAGGEAGSGGHGGAGGEAGSGGQGGSGGEAGSGGQGGAGGAGGAAGGSDGS
ncbi:hypothetical protein [Sorangium sp. So ce1389]|uniref:hypothetical protein n=1 Tax=Sorangium sp. So ce1389 TaxID=3133336 RepID=UPI003F6079AA